MKPKSAKKSEIYTPLPVVPRGELEPVCLAFPPLMARLRGERGLSFTTLARLTRLSRRFVALVEQGQRQPTLESISRISHALGREPEVMISEALASVG